MNAIHLVISGRIYVSEEVNAKRLEKSIGGTVNMAENQAEILNDLEFEVFRLVDQGYKPKQITGELNFCERTIENYRMHIREKLYFKNAAELSCFAIEWFWNQKLRNSE